MDISTSLQIVALWAAAAAGLTKGTVDVIKRSYPALASALVLLLAVCFSIVYIFLISVMVGDPMTLQIVARNLLAGILAAFGAVGLNSLHNGAETSKMVHYAGVDLDEHPTLAAYKAPDLAPVSTYTPGANVPPSKLKDIPGGIVSPVQAPDPPEASQR